MPRLYHITVVMLIMMAARPGAAAPTGGAGMPRETLKPIKDAAEYLRDVRQPSCSAVTAGAELPPENLSSALTYEEISVMLGLAGLEQPRVPSEDPEARAGQIQDKLDAAVDARIAAYQCIPGPAGKRHLEAAIDLLRVWERQLREVEQLPNSAPNYVQIQQKIAALVALMPPESRPPCPKPNCAVEDRSPHKTPKGYARFMELLTLRMELGIGGGKLTYRKDTTDEEPGENTSTTVVLGPALRLFAGIRLLDVKRRHALLIGGFYGFQHITKHDISFVTPSVFNIVHAGGLQLEWGIRVSGGAVSFHPAVDFGAQSFLGESTFGHLRLGGAFGLCVGGEVVCLIPRFFTGLQHTNGREFRGYQVNIGVDVFRLVDRALNRSAATASSPSTRERSTRASTRCVL